MSSLPVKPELGPTLPQLLRRASRPVRLAALAAGAVLALLLIAGALGGVTADETHAVVEEPTAFNLRYGPTLDRVDTEAGELLALEARRGDLFLQSFRVTPLELDPYEGLAAGELPIVAEELKDRLARRFDEFRLVEEGRMRINEVPGYEVVFSARSEDDRRLYGRWVMMLPESDPAHPAQEGVTLELLGTPAAGIPNAEQIGDQGQLKLPMRSFRFGTEAP